MFRKGGTGFALFVIAAFVAVVLCGCGGVPAGPVANSVTELGVDWAALAGREEFTWEGGFPPCPPDYVCLSLKETIYANANTEITCGEGQAEELAEISGSEITQVLSHNGSDVIVVWDTTEVGGEHTYRGVRYGGSDGVTLADEAGEPVLVIVPPGCGVLLSQISYMGEGWLTGVRVGVSNPVVPPVEGDFATQQR